MMGECPLLKGQSSLQIGAWCRKFSYTPTRSRVPRRRQVVGVVSEMALDAFFPAMGVKPEAAVLASAVLATSSVVANFFSGMQLEQRRAELALEVGYCCMYKYCII